MRRCSSRENAEPPTNHKWTKSDVARAWYAARNSDAPFLYPARGPTHTTYGLPLGRPCRRAHASSVSSEASSSSFVNRNASTRSTPFVERTIFSVTVEEYASPSARAVALDTVTTRSAARTARRLSRQYGEEVSHPKRSGVASCTTSTERSALRSAGCATIVCSVEAKAVAPYQSQSKPSTTASAAWSWSSAKGGASTTVSPPTEGTSMAWAPPRRRKTTSTLWGRRASLGSTVAQTRRTPP
mmetsp:Transcript_11132/g.45088  ORF Transcript_11132/g.45088 Transcript_11132/m.45088 type:complete len:242 (-) Transcript_11132:162-887(-)